MKVRLAVYTLAAVVLAPVSAIAAPARTPAAATSELSAADQAFLSARDAVRVGDRERLAQAAARLADHPLAAYIEYWQLLGQIRSAEPKAASDVAQFMSRHAGYLHCRSAALRCCSRLGEPRRLPRVRTGGGATCMVDRRRAIPLLFGVVEVPARCRQASRRYCARSASAARKYDQCCR